MKKFKLKVPKYTFDHKGMIIRGEQLESLPLVNVYARDLCNDNMDIMSKADIRQCMASGNDFVWRYELDELDELESLEQIKLTQLDYEMLKLVQKQGAKYICRDEGGVLNICATGPYQSEYEEGIWWSTGETAYLNEFFSKLFQFVKWEDKKYYVIEDVLNNCEVVEDD